MQESKKTKFFEATWNELITKNFTLQSFVREYKSWYLQTFETHTIPPIIIVLPVVTNQGIVHLVIDPKTPMDYVFFGVFHTALEEMERVVHVRTIHVCSALPTTQIQTARFARYRLPDGTCENNRHIPVDNKNAVLNSQMCGKCGKPVI